MAGTRQRAASTVAGMTTMTCSHPACSTVPAPGLRQEVGDPTRCAAHQPTTGGPATTSPATTVPAQPPVTYLPAGDPDDASAEDEEEQDDSDDGDFDLDQLAAKAAAAAPALTDAQMVARAAAAAAAYERADRFDRLTDALGATGLLAARDEDGTVLCLACVNVADAESGDVEYIPLSYRRIDLYDECHGCGNELAEALPSEVADAYDA